MVTGNPMEAGVTLIDKDGNEFLYRRVALHYITSSHKSVKEVLEDLTHFHDEMPNVPKHVVKPEAARNTADEVPVPVRQFFVRKRKE